MAILGQPVSGLGSWGGPAGSWRFPILIPIAFELQIAGAFQGTFVSTGNFCQAANAGIQFIVTILDENLNPLDISGATALKLAFKLPSGQHVPKFAQYVTNGRDGRLFYTSLPTDFMQSGLTYVQAQVTIGGAILTTAWGQFEVNPNL